jgi:hypothetical protein
MHDCKKGNEAIIRCQAPVSRYTNITLKVDKVKISAITNFKRIEYANPKKDYLDVELLDCPENIEDNHAINMLRAKKRFNKLHLRLDKLCQNGETTKDDIELFNGVISYISQSYSPEDQGILRMEFEVLEGEGNK